MNLLSETNKGLRGLVGASGPSGVKGIKVCSPTWSLHFPSYCRFPPASVSSVPARLSEKMKCVEFVCGSFITDFDSSPCFCHAQQTALALHAHVSLPFGPRRLHELWLLLCDHHVALGASYHEKPLDSNDRVFLFVVWTWSQGERGLPGLPGDVVSARNRPKRRRNYRLVQRWHNGGIVARI